MAIINNNVQNVSFLRNQTPVASREAAITLFDTAKADAKDGSILLARYTSGNEVKTLAGLVAVSGETKYVTIIDVEGASADVQELREEINAKLGNDITSANTASAQLAALSGTNADTSATTSVVGAKKYADEKISEAITNLDYAGVTTGTGVYVTNVTEVDGVVSATTATLPTVADSASAKTFVTSVSENLGEISVSKGSIESSAGTIVLTDTDDGGVNFEVHIDGVSILKNAQGELSVANSALIQYVGDEKTINVSEASEGVKTISSLLTLSSVTPSSEVVKEEYALKNASGETIGSTIKIYKDSHIVSIDYIDDPADPNYQKLEYVYVNDSGATSTTYVDMSELVLEAEFASGVTFSNGVAHGVVDPQSELDSSDAAFLTVGADGFKISGVKAEIAAQLEDVVEDLDATVTGATSGNHVTISIEELDGKLVQSGLTIEENDIASAADLAALSAKTITELTSANDSITIFDGTIADDGTMSFDIITDASKIKMSGFTSTDALSGITEDDSITEAFQEVDKVITENEQVTSAALNDLNDKIAELSGDSQSGLTEEIAARERVDGITGSAYTATASANYISGATSLNDADQKLDAAIDNIADKYVSGITMNGSGVTVTDNVAALTIVSAPATGAATSPINVATDGNGGVTLTITNIDCGYYATE